MRKRETYDDIYKQIQSEADAPLPDALQPEAIANLVKSAEQAPKEKHIARYASLAAAVVLVTLAGVAGVRWFGNTPNVTPPQSPKQSASADLDDAYLRSPQDYKEIEDYFVARQAAYKAAYENNDYSLLDRIFSGGKKSVKMFADGAVGSVEKSYSGVPEAANAASGGTGTSAPTHGKTNTQVENIDEADILKNDGNYLYTVRQTDNSCVEILDIRDRTKICLSAKIQAASVEDNETVTVQEIYVHENTLVVLSAVMREERTDNRTLADTCYAYTVTGSRTVADIYDITDRTAPVLLQSYGVDGGMLSSRMDGDTLILLTNYNVPIYKDETDMKNACVPCYYQDSEKTRFPVNDVKLPEDMNDTSYLTISLVNTKDKDAAPKAKAILGGGQNVYCGADTLLVARMEAQNSITEANGAVTYSVWNQTTRLYAFDLSNGADYKGSATVKGAVLNQFSMDAYNGYYRIATTLSNRDGCVLTVLDKDLKTVGELSGIAKGEDIYAARFLGDTAYLITYYQTDPLFIIDLQNPEKPEIKGELKIPGFSNYLHPYGQGLLIGVGSDGTENGATDQVKISLYDVSDCQNPREISKAVYGADKSTYSYSEAQYDHKAYLSFADSGEFAVPICESTGNKDKSYASVLTVENGTLKITGTYTPESTDTYFQNNQIRRVTYSGDTVYTLSDTAITAFDRATGEVLFAYSTPENASPTGGTK